MSERETSMLFALLGVLCGLAVVALLNALLKRRNQKRGRRLFEYDERQLVEQARAGRMAFLILIVLAFLSGALREFELTGGLSPLTMSAVCVWIALCAYAWRCISRDAYVSLNERRGALMLIFLLSFVVNLAIGLIDLLDGGELGFGGVNIVTAAGSLCISAALGLRGMRARRAGGVEE